MTPPVSTVLFDIDDTLCEYRRPGRDLLAHSFDAVGVEPFFTIEDYYARYAAFSDNTDTIDELRAECFATLATNRNRDSELGRAVAAAYSTERDPSDVVPMSGARKAVAALADDHRLGVVTNGPPGMQSAKLTAIELDDAFETVVFAGYDAAAKPDPEPFRLALAELDGDPDSSVHIGNSLSSDVAGARAAGLRSVWLADGTDPDPNPDYVLDSMSELTTPPWRI